MPSTLSKEKKTRQPGGTWFWYVAIYWLYLCMKLLFRLKVRGKINLPARGPAILAANHASYMDPPVVGVSAAPRPIRFMAKEGLFRVPILGFVITKLHAFPVAREDTSRETIRTALDALELGMFVGIFPQGTRVKDGSLELTRGVSLIAEYSGAPVVPMAISGTERIWKGGVFPIRLPKVEVAIGEPMSFRRHPGEPARDARERFSQELAAEIMRLLKMIKSGAYG